MKWIPVIALVIFTPVSLAQEQTAPTETAKVETQSTTAAESKAAETVNILGQRYIKDSLSIPLRSGASSGFKIINKGLNSGTKVTLLKVNDESQYSLVRTSDGIEGWLPSQFLMEDMPSTLQLIQAQEMIKKLSLQSGPNGEQLIDVNKKNLELSHTIEQLQEELEHIKSISADEIRLSEENKKILADYEEIKNKRDTLVSENQRLHSQVTQDSFMNGSIAVILGIIATLIIQHLTKANKRHSDWA